MEKSFEYLRVISALDSINIQDIGNCIISANNDQELEWIIQVYTDCGYTTIKEFGPLFRDMEVAMRSFNYSVERKEYNEKNISNRINKFLNDPKREITQVMEIDEFDLNDKLAQVRSYL